MATSLPCCVAVLLMVTSAHLLAQQPAAPPADATALAKQSQNPVGNLVSVPLQFSFNTGGDLGERTFLNVNFQPVNFNFGPGWAISFSPVITANWDAPAGERWTVPVGLGLTRTVVFNRRPMNLGISYNYNLEHPTGTAGEQLRFTVTLLYPR